MTPLERAARAIALCYICERDARDADDPYAVSYAENCWHNHINEARAATEALSESLRHPVDVLKWCIEQMGREIDPEAEAKLREICDEMVPVL